MRVLKVLSSGAAEAAVLGIPQRRRSTSCSCRMPIFSQALAKSSDSEWIFVFRLLIVARGQLLDVCKGYATAVRLKVVS